MPDISDLTHEQLPSSKSLIKASIIAVIVAIAVLIIAVLPAEYGLDPTGFGKQLGLTELADGNDQLQAAPIVDTNNESLIQEMSAVYISQEPYKTKKLSMPLFPQQGIEVKAVMNEGDLLIYNWSASNTLYMDMHGEMFNAKSDEFTSYWEENNINQASGNLVANFSGTHGWYWKNNTDEVIDLNVEVSGFYSDVYIP